MSDFLKIDNLVNMFKTRVAKDKHGDSYAFFSKVKGKKQLGFFEQDDEVDFLEHAQITKLVEAGQRLGLSEQEAIEALEIMAKSLSKYCKTLDVSDFILSNDSIHFPYDEESIHFNDKILQEIEKNFPDMYLAIKHPFKFFCKYPKTLTREYYKKFTYSEILEFHRLHPEESESLSNNQEKK